jgi:protein TonB
VNLEACKPRPEDYPRAAVRAGTTGRTLLRIAIEADGRVARIDVEQPSGATREHRQLDALAARKFGECRYQPAIDDTGQAVPGMLRFDLKWNLEERS